MDPEQQKLLKETYKLAKENNHLLHKVRNFQRTSAFLKLIYWVVIIGIAIGAFYFLQPYIESAKDGYNTINSNINSVKGFIDGIKMP